MAHLAKHMDVNAIYLTDNLKYKKSVQEEATQNLKRVVLGNKKPWIDTSIENPYIITDFMETKTTWHPIEFISETGQDINFKNMEGSKKRHIAKTLTWRITATLTTMIIAWVVSGDPMTGLTVGGIEFLSKCQFIIYTKEHGTNQILELMAEINEEQLLELAKKAAIAGGAEIMEVYRGEFEVVEKEDQSPLTIADQHSNEVIEKLLNASGIPILRRRNT